MALADDLVAEAALAIRDAYDIDCGIPAENRPTLDAVDWTPEARAAVAATLRTFAASGDYPTDRRSLLALSSDLDRAIRQWCDDRDAEHATTGCPSGPACLHASVAAIRAVLDLHPPVTLLVWPEPDAYPDAPLPERTVCRPCGSEGSFQDYPCPEVQAIAAALGVAGERRDAESGD